MIGRTIRDLRDEMAEALEPIMGEAIRVQIRDFAQGYDRSLVSRYRRNGTSAPWANSPEEFQRNIDAPIERQPLDPNGDDAG